MRRGRPPGRGRARLRRRRSGRAPRSARCAIALARGSARAEASTSLGPAVRQHVGVVVGGEQGVHRHRHDAGEQAAEESSPATRWCRASASSTRSSRRTPAAAGPRRSGANGPRARRSSGGRDRRHRRSWRPAPHCARTGRRKVAGGGWGDSCGRHGGLQRQTNERTDERATLSTGLGRPNVLYGSSVRLAAQASMHYCACSDTIVSCRASVKHYIA